jgi:release factor glutamine methyltransferase
VADRIDFVQSDLLPATSARFDLICANVPYIPDYKLPLLKASIWEPRLALAGGPDGLDLVRRLLAQARAALAPGGLALLEIEASQGESALRLAQDSFPHAKVAVLPDLAGRDRLLRVEM